MVEGTYQNLGSVPPSPLNYYSIPIGFCGKIYRAFYLTYLNEKSFCYNIEDVDKFVATLSPKAQDAYISTCEYTIFNRKYNGILDWNNRRKNFVTQFDRQIEHHKYQDLFVNNYTPAFFHTLTENLKHKKSGIFHPHYHQQKGRYTYSYNKEYSTSIVFNCNLDQFEFYKVFNPYQAYQEISMFLGGLAVPLNNIPHIDDKIMAEAKGFDKFSFRKDKTKK